MVRWTENPEAEVQLLVVPQSRTCIEAREIWKLGYYSETQVRILYGPNRAVRNSGLIRGAVTVR